MVSVGGLEITQANVVILLEGQRKRYPNGQQALQLCVGVVWSGLGYLVAQLQLALKRKTG